MRLTHAQAHKAISAIVALCMAATLAIVALTMLMGGCAHPPPKPVSVPTTQQDAGPSCSAACDRVRQLGCPWWSPDAGTCESGCEALINAMPDGTVDLACIAQAPDCNVALGCVH